MGETVGAASVSEELAAFARCIPVAVVITTADGRILFGNERFESVVARPAQDLWLHPLDDLLPGHADLRGRLDGAPSGGGTPTLVQGRSTLRSDGGAVAHPVLVGVAGMAGARSGQDVVVTTVLDAHGRVEDRLRAVIDAAPLAMLMVDEGGRITMVNADAERQFGYSRGELRGRLVEELIPQRSRERHPALRADYQEDPKVRQMGAGRSLFAVRRDGEEFPVEVGLSPVRTDEGIFTVAAVVDTTQRSRHANRALVQANDLLLRSNAELQRFAYVASHDLQTPMRTIGSFATLLDITYGDALDEQARDWISRIQAGVSHLQTLVSDLLAFSGVDASERGFVAVDLEETVQEALDLLRGTLVAESATVTHDPLPTVLGDPSQLSQVLLNLIGNGVKYRGEQAPTVHVAARRDGDEFVISVRDNGIGIEPQHQTQIFEPFVRLHRRHEYPGSGIGLAICRKVVERHGGTLTVDSAPGRGSTFRFTLPSPRSERP